MQLILVIDTGSSSMRGILFDLNGHIITKVQKKYHMDVSPDGRAEQSPSDFSCCLISICRSCANTAAELNAFVSVISFTSQRSSILPITFDGKILHPFITWYDKRSAGICGEINRADGDEIYGIAGMRPTPVFSAPKMRWLKLNKPDIYDRADKIIGIHDYLLYLCTDKFITDASLASRTCLLDTRTKQWSDRLIEIFDLDKDKLCPIADPGSAVGHITDNFSGLTGLSTDTLVVSAGGDQQCSALGQGLFVPGMAGITVGTGAYIEVICDSPVFDEKHRVNLNVAASPGQWVMEVSTLSSGSVYDWFNRIFYPEREPSFPNELINKEVSESPAGANGVLMLPDLAGKGCPAWDDQARGTFYNLNLATSRGDCARALLEGIAAEIAECHHVLTGLNHRIKDVKITGGLSQFDQFNQMVADMINFPVEKSRTEESTAVGAFLSAAAAAGLFPSLETAFTHCFCSDENKTIFTPNPDHVILYQRINRARRLLEQSLPHREISSLLNGGSDPVINDRQSDVRV